MWKDGASLKKIMAVTIEEEFLHFLLTVSIKSAAEGLSTPDKNITKNDKNSENGKTDKNDKNDKNSKYGKNSKNQKNDSTDGSDGNDGTSPLEDYMHIAMKLLHQLYGLERFLTIFQLTLYDNKMLKSSMIRTVGCVLTFVGQERGKLLSEDATQTGQSNNNSNNNSNNGNNGNTDVDDAKDKKKALVSLEKSFDSLTKINALLV